MKKILFALAALVLAFTGCSQEEDAIQVSEKKAVKVVVNMDKPGFGEDTRAARTGWEKNDQVIVVLDDDFEPLIVLMYDGTSWEEVVLSFVDGEWEEVDEAEGYLADLTNGSLKAIYCSSGISYPAPIPDYAVTVEDLEGIDIYSKAREAEMGECIMTCDNGTYEVEETADGYVLKLTITMIPQVAQFTIKDLSDDGDEEEGKTSEGLEVGVAGGNLVAYSGGTITSSGIMMCPVNTAGLYNACWVHPNTDGINPVGISIYASTSGSNNFDDEDTYTFSVGDGYNRNFNCNEYKDRIYNGAAIIMAGPYTDGAEDKWSAPE